MLDLPHAESPTRTTVVESISVSIELKICGDKESHFLLSFLEPDKKYSRLVATALGKRVRLTPENERRPVGKL